MEHVHKLWLATGEATYHGQPGRFAVLGDGAVWLELTDGRGFQARLDELEDVRWDYPDTTSKILAQLLT